jgi:hypothetical protein
MKRQNAYVNFIARYLVRGAVGVSVGFAAVAPASAKPTGDAAASERAFADRLAMIRAAVSDHVNPTVVDPSPVDPSFDLAQILPHPPPPPPPRPFSNFFGKAPFSDAWRNVPAPPPK